jgi:hypothetical protein
MLVLARKSRSNLHPEHAEPIFATPFAFDQGCSPEQARASLPLRAVFDDMLIAGVRQSLSEFWVLLHLQPEA